MSSKTVLVVDDNPGNLTLIKMLLSRQDFDVRTAASGQEALDFLATEKPILVLLDIKMPHIDGFAVCKYIKQSERLMDISVFMISAVNDPRDFQHADEVGADAYLVKPIEIARLLELIAQFVP